MGIESLVLCAGLAERMGHLTRRRPKCALPVAGRPLIEWTMRWLAVHRVRSAMVTLSANHGVVTRLLDKAHGFGLDCRYLLEGDEPYGTAASMGIVMDKLADPFLLVYGDILSDANLTDLRQCHRGYGSEARATLAAHKRPNLQDAGVVTVSRGLVVGFEEKPAKPKGELAFAGLAVIDHAAVRPFLGAGPDFTADVLPRVLSARILCLPWTVDGYLLDVGTPARYAQANKEWPTEKASAWVPGQEPAQCTP